MTSRLQLILTLRAPGEVTRHAALRLIPGGIWLGYQRISDLINKSHVLKMYKRSAVKAL